MKIKKSLFIFLIVFSLVPLYLMTGILTYNLTSQVIHPIEQMEYTLKRMVSRANDMKAKVVVGFLHAGAPEHG